MFKQSSKIALISFGLIALASCSKHAEVIGGGFTGFQENPPINPGDQSQCADGAASPITLENANGTAIDPDSIQAKGTLTYVGADFFYEVSDGANSIAKAYAKEAAGETRPKIECSSQLLGALPKEVQLSVTLELPTAGKVGVTEMERFAVLFYSDYLAVTTGTAPAQLATMKSILASMKDTQTQFYDLGAGKYELRVTATETLEGKYNVKKSAIVRYSSEAVQ